MPKYRQTYTLFKRGKYYYYRTYTPDGIRTTAKTTGKTSLSAARLYCDELFKAGKLFSKAGKTFKEYADGFFAPDSVYTKDNALSASSIKGYNSAMDNTFMPMLGNKKLEDITYSFLKKFRQELLDAGQSPATVKHKMSILHIIMKTAYLDGIIPKDPFVDLKGLKAAEEHRDAFTMEETKLVYEAADSEIKVYIVLLALTGLRYSEMMAVALEPDIRSNDGIFYIHLEKQYLYGKFCQLKTKSARDIPIPEKLVPLAEKAPKTINLRKRLGHTLHIIPNWKERKLCAHSLRHFFISSAKSYGINHLKVEAIAGHSLRGIQEVYTNFKVPDLAEIIKWQEWAYCQITGIEIK